MCGSNRTLEHFQCVWDVWGLAKVSKKPLYLFERGLPARWASTAYASVDTCRFGSMPVTSSGQGRLETELLLPFPAWWRKAQQEELDPDMPIMLLPQLPTESAPRHIAMSMPSFSPAAPPPATHVHALFSAAEAYRALVSTGEGKSSASFFKLAVLGIAAGCYISFGFSFCAVVTGAVSVYTRRQ